MNNNFVQIVRQTWQERYNMYMSLPKEKLASMLAESAKITNPDGCKECETISFAEIYF